MNRHQHNSFTALSPGAAVWPKVCRPMTPPAPFLATERVVMDRDDIIQVVQADLDHYQKQWEAFCERIETYAADLESQSRAALKDYEDRAGVNYEPVGTKGRKRTKTRRKPQPEGPTIGPLEAVIEAAYTQGAPESRLLLGTARGFRLAECLDEPELLLLAETRQDEPAACGLRSPRRPMSESAGRRNGSARRTDAGTVSLSDLTGEEQLLCDCAVLSIVHDYDPTLGAGDGRIFQRQLPTTGGTSRETSSVKQYGKRLRLKAQAAGAGWYGTGLKGVHGRRFQGSPGTVLVA